MYFTLFLRKLCSSLQCMIFLPLFSSTEAKLHLQSQWYVYIVFLMNSWVTLFQTFISRLRVFENWVVTLLVRGFIYLFPFEKKTHIQLDYCCWKDDILLKKIFSARKSHLIGKGLFCFRKKIPSQKERRTICEWTCVLKIRFIIKIFILWACLAAGLGEQVLLASYGMDESSY